MLEQFWANNFPMNSSEYSSLLLLSDIPWDRYDHGKNFYAQGISSKQFSSEFERALVLAQPSILPSLVVLNFKNPSLEDGVRFNSGKLKHVLTVWQKVVSVGNLSLRAKVKYLNLHAKNGINERHLNRFKATCKECIFLVLKIFSPKKGVKRGWT